MPDLGDAQSIQDLCGLATSVSASANANDLILFLCGRLTQLSVDKIRETSEWNILGRH